MPETKPSISREGRIGIGLSLLFGAGAGAIMIWPSQVWIGWTLIAVAVLGLIALGIYHFRAERNPKPKTPPIPLGAASLETRPTFLETPEMTIPDAGFIVACTAAIVAIIASLRRHRMVAVIAALIACIAVTADFIERHWNHTETETGLSADNARLDMVPQPFWKDADKSFYMNFYLVNSGKTTALKQHRYGLAIGSSANLDPDLIDAYFFMAKAKIRKSTPGDNEYPPGPTGQFFSVPDTSPGLQFGSDAGYQAAKDGKIPIYALVLERYRDPSLPVGKFIYTEKCIYLIGGVIHNCEGHNRSYISD